MNLKNVRILIDGYNLELSQGTGVKTYGLSLIKALNSLQAEIEVLYSSEIKNSKNKDTPLTEVLFFDRNYQKVSIVAKILLMAKLLSKIPVAPQRPKLHDVVIRNTKDIVSSQILYFSGIVTLPLCYQASNYLFRKLNRELILKSSNDWKIFHATYPLPFKVKGVKKITTIHDLIPLRLPYTILDDKNFFYHLIQYSIKTSDLIITVSEHSKKDLVEIFNCHPQKIAVTYQPIALTKQEKSVEKISVYLRKYKLKYQKYLLFVGALEPKKNLGTLIDAYAMLNTDLPLVIVGKKAWLYEQDLAKIDFLFKGKNQQRTEQEKIFVLDYVPTEDLPYLFQGAYCFVFPVIASKVASLPEVCGDAALYVDPYNVEDLKEKLQQILTDGDLRNCLSAAGRKRAELFSMDNYKKRLMIAYNQVLNQ